MRRWRGLAALVTLALAVTGVGSPAGAQSEKRTVRIGMFTAGVNPRTVHFPYDERLRELGYIEGRNLVIEWRQAQKPEQASAIAAELVRLKVDAILAFGAEISLRAASEATKTIPIMRRAAELTDRILKGAQPSDLPVEQPTSFELIVNLKVAKTLDVKIPQSLLSRADRIVE